jgi:DNA-binding IclR family transcriptional regulator
MSRTRTGAESETVQAVVRALSILEVLSEVSTPISVTELAKKVGLKLTTVHRLLTTLMSKGFVEQEEQTMRYKIGIKAFQVGNSALHSMDIRSIARPYLKELVEKINETTNLALLDGDEVVYIDQVESTNIVIVKMFARIGSRGAAYCTGSGKVMLSALPDDKLWKVIDNINFERFTENTITDKEQFYQEIKKIREQGYAIDNAERDEGVCCVAAPLRNHEGRTVAAISISGPNTRVNSQSLEGIISAVTETALTISQRLGYRQTA